MTPHDAMPAWDQLSRHFDDVAPLHLRDLFAEDPSRGERLNLEAVGIYLDYSKHRITDETLGLLFDLARTCNIEQWRDAMFAGERINTSEDRSVLHIALRLPRDASLIVDGVDIVPEVHRVLDNMASFADAVRSGAWKGFSGQRIRHVVNIGIGGSDLGPVMAYEALRHFATPDLSFHFVSNMDATDLTETLTGLDPAETLFIVASKTFTTLETMANAHSARAWILQAFDDDGAIAQHFVAVSTNRAEVEAFGIASEHMFEFWDWVGGRYSLCSAIGLSTMIAIGPKQFGQLLDGFHAMDEHFRSAPLEENMPVIMGLLAVWYREFFDAQSTGVMPYDEYLHRFPAYLQQLTMESNGKHVTRDGEPVQTKTGAIYWGEAGTNGQHSFFQLLHAGSMIVPLDLIGFARGLNSLGDHHDVLSANIFAQAQAFAFGRSEAQVRAEGTPEELVPHRVMPGNRPTSVLLSDELSPYRLGSLVALYEHSVFVQGAIWAIDSFDQWGVELGKSLLSEITPQLIAGAPAPRQQDSSTTSLIRHYLQLRDGEN